MGKTVILKKAIKAVTPPILLWGAKKLFFKTPSPLELFDGDDSMYKLLLQNTRIYGEYGCGASTKWVLANTSAEILAVDTSKQWIDEVKKDFDVANLKKRAEIHHVDLGELKSWGRPISYAKQNDFPHYTNWIWEQSKKPDTVLIDGRFRVCSFLTSLKFAAEGTKLIFDDYTNRPHYHIVEKYVEREDACGRQCLFVVPNSSCIDYEKLDAEIKNFRHVMD